MTRPPSFQLRADELRRLRESRELTQAGLAAKLEVSTDTIRGWEAKRRSPTLRRVHQLARELRVAPTDLIEPPRNDLPADLRRRADADLTAADLAEQLNISRKRVRQAESADILPDHADQWAKAVGVKKATLARAWIRAALVRPYRQAITGAMARGGSTPPSLGASWPLADIRSINGLTAEQVAQELGVHSSTISRVESGEILPSTPPQWAAAYQIDEPTLARSWLIGALGYDLDLASQVLDQDSRPR